MIEHKFHVQDDMGLLEEGYHYPYVSFYMTDEDMKSFPESFRTFWYMTDGKKLFDEKDKDGNLTGKKIAFLLFERK